MKKFISLKKVFLAFQISDWTELGKDLRSYINVGLKVKVRRTGGRICPASRKELFELKVGLSSFSYFEKSMKPNKCWLYGWEDIGFYEDALLAYLCHTVDFFPERI